MKKFLTAILSVCMLGGTMLAASCSEEEAYVPKAGTLALPHYNGIVSTDVDGVIEGDGTYDSDLLYYGENHIWGADEGVIWVSEEQGGPEYGGYFYMYVAGTGGGVNDKGHTTDVNPEGYPEGSNMMVMCYRSRDLNDWKLCGAIENGWSLYLDPDTWVGRALWAAEVIYNPADGKYYMYFTAQTRTNDGSIPGATYQNYDDCKEGNDNWARFSAGVACSDTPVGPFYMVSSERNYNGGANPNGDVISHVNPTFDLQSGLSMDDKFPFIDPHPVFIDGQLYLFFAQHLCSGLGIKGNSIWGMKMLDMATPDFSSVRYLLGYGNVQSVVYNEGPVWNTASYTTTDFANPTEDNRGIITEAPTLLTREVNGKTKYYLLSSPHGVSNPKYDVDIAVADAPLGPYKKLSHSEGGLFLTVDEQNDFMSSLGHCSVLRAGSETYCVFGTSQFYGSTSLNGGRFYAFAPVGWYYDSDLGYELPVVNGPLRHLQPRPEVATGYGNVAGKASVSTVNMNDATLGYLTDGLVPTQQRISHLEASTAKLSASISFTFNEPVAMRGVCVYNSYQFATAFKKIDYITFELAEETTIGGVPTSTVAIKDLPFDQAYVDFERQTLRPGGASIATFKEIKVNWVTFTLSTPIMAGANELRLAEIVLLGK